ncbi:MAG: metallophosphoesterase [Thermoflexibacter sp.]
MYKIVAIVILTLLLIAVDFYVFQAIKTVFDDKNATSTKIIYWTFWSLNVLTILGVLAYNLVPRSGFFLTVTRFVLVWSVIFYFSKVFAVLFLLIDDIVRLLQWVYYQFTGFPTKATIIEATHQTNAEGEELIPRSEFLSKAGLIAATTPLLTMSYGVLSGAHDYQVHRKILYLPNLPKSFDGLRFAQLSDIHSGSFFNKVAVKGGIEMLLREKPDVVFFTGDLVNNEASEMRDYQDIFAKVKAPLGVYSTLGNHDYGDYVMWASAEAKRKNLEDLKATHKLMGWNLLMNESRYLSQNGDKIAILGIENWSAKGRFPKYGSLAKAYENTEEASVKILLSHDPSHWRAEVLEQYKDIDLMLAGHTHGMQFGIEIGNFRWSPVQYFYEEWADLYSQSNQHLYVNRGFGFIGYPGRIGILPEICIFELKRA